MSKILAIVALAGFAIQQLLEILDPLVTWMIRKYIASRKPDGTDLSEAELKKWWMAMLAFFVGWVTVIMTKISLLEFVDPSWAHSYGDILITALVLGAGTEGLNTLTKYFGYVKDGRKAAIPPVVEINIVPTSATVKKNDSLQFISIVKNTPFVDVTWTVAHGSGGTIDESGLYEAPTVSGTYLIVATSKADATKYATASVVVTA